jgi:hypothetical protein
MEEREVGRKVVTNERNEDEWSPSARDIIATRTWFDLKKRMRPPLRAETMLLWSDMMLMDRGLGRYVPFDSGI